MIGGEQGERVRLILESKQQGEERTELLTLEGGQLTFAAAASSFEVKLEGEVGCVSAVHFLVMIEGGAVAG